MRTVSSPSVRTRPSWTGRRAGRTAGARAGPPAGKPTVRTDRRKPSAAASVNLLSSISNRTPVRTGRESSVEAAKATWAITSRNSLTGRVTPSSPGAGGIGGNSWLSMHLMSLRNEPHSMCRVCVRTTRAISTLSLGMVLTRSTSVAAGAVVEPSSSTLAPIQQVIPISRLVAERRRRPPSVASRILLSTGSVLRREAARLTTPRPRARFSCRQETFIAADSSERKARRGKYTRKAIVSGQWTVDLDQALLFHSERVRQIAAPRGFLAPLRAARNDIWYELGAQGILNHVIPRPRATAAGPRNPQ